MAICYFMTMFCKLFSEKSVWHRWLYLQYHNHQHSESCSAGKCALISIWNQNTTQISSNNKDEPCSNYLNSTVPLQLPVQFHLVIYVYYNTSNHNISGNYRYKTYLISMFPQQPATGLLLTAFYGIVPKFFINPIG